VADISDVPNSPVTVIAEIGVNHNGSMELAKELILRAKESGADYAKFQTFQSESLASDRATLASYQAAQTTQANQRELLKSLELRNADFLDLEKFCSEHAIGFLTTAHDLRSAVFVLEMNLDFVKVPSGDVTNLPFLEVVGRSGKPVLLSTGMADYHEVEAAVAVLVANGLPLEKITVLQCTTEYPAPIEHANLRAMVSMGKALGVSIGYSDHTLGFTATIAAVALGARVIEKHLTVNRTLPGPDHRASLEPEEFGEMVREIRKTVSALGDGVK
jgi:sialic acid synthase SpsE